MQSYVSKPLYFFLTTVLVAFKHTIPKSALLAFLFVTNVSAVEFYYKWNNSYFTSPIDASNAAIDNINAGSGDNFTFDSIIWDDCPRGYDAHCATGSASQNQFPFSITLTIASRRTEYSLATPLNNNQPNLCTGNPIDPVTGNKLQREQLIEINAVHPITFDLYYNSNRLEKWRHSFSRTLSFSSAPNGPRFDFNGSAFGVDPVAQPESPSIFGGQITSYGAQYTPPESTNLITYPTVEKACSSGWINNKKYYHYSWIPTSVGELRQTPISSYGAISQCYILDAPGGQVKMILDVYDVIAGHPPGYGQLPVFNTAAGNYLRFTRANGSVVVFSPEILGMNNLSNTGETLVKIDTAGVITYRLSTSENEVEEYSSSGKLLSITSAQGHVQSLIYDGATGLLNQIVNQTGESLTFVYETYGDTSQYWRIKTITDNDNRIWTFNYNAIEYTLAAIDMPDGTQRQYHYEDAANVQLLTGITDETTQRYATWAYDGASRAILSAHGVGQVKDRVELDYQDALKKGQRIVTTKRTSGMTGGLDVDIVSTYVTHIGGSSPIVAEVTGNNSVKFEHDATTGYLEYVEDKGLRTEYSLYDNKGNPGKIVEAAATPEQRQTTYTYDPRYHSKIATITEASVFPGNQKITTNLYDDFGNNTSVTINGFKPDGTAVSRTTTFQYNGPFYQLTQIDGPRTDVSDVYTINYYADDVSQGNNRARIKRVTTPLNIALYDNITYTPTGKIKTYIDANNTQSTLSYYYGNDRLQSLSQLDLNTGDTRLTQWTYLATGEVKTVTSGADVVDKTTLTFNYDDARRLTSIVDGLGNSIEYILDSEGNVEQENIRDDIGSLRKRLTQTFDDYNHLQLRTQVNEQLTETRSPDGTLDKTVDGKNVTTDYSYDNLRRLTQINQDMGGNSPQTADAFTILNYDVQDNLTGITDSNGGQTTYIYDDLGNLITETSPDTGTRTYTHDEAGNISSLIDAKLQLFNYTYDALNRLISIDAPGSEDDVNNTYDTCPGGNGRLCNSQRNNSTLSYQYNGFGDITNLDQSINTWTGYNHASNSVAYNYDTAGRISNINYPSGVIIRYTYDVAGNINQVTLSQNGVDTFLSKNILYRPFDDIKSQAYGNNLILLNMKDQAYRPFINGTPNLYFDYLKSYDENGNPTNSIALDSGLYLTQNYSYDAHNRLVSSAGLLGDYNYDYDKVGNRTREIQDGSTTNSSYQPQSNKLAMLGNEAIIMDANGNTENVHGLSLGYTTDNRLKSTSAGSKYQYNGLGQRVVKQLKAPGVAGTNGYYQSRTYMYDLNGKLLAETGPTGQVQKEYIYLNDQPLAMLVHRPSSKENFLNADMDNDGVISVEDFVTWYFNHYMRNDLSKDLNGDNVLDGSDANLLINCAITQNSCKAASYDTNIYYIHNDHLGTPKLLTDETGASVWQAIATPFGKATVDEDVDGNGEKVVMNLRFPGQYYDGESGLHYNYFRTYDPELGRYLTSDPIGLFGGVNTFEYAGGNPMIYSDYYGLKSSIGIGGQIGSTTVGVSGGYDNGKFWNSGTQWGQTTQIGIGFGIEICFNLPDEPSDDDTSNSDCEDKKSDDLLPDNLTFGAGRHLGLSFGRNGSFCINAGPSRSALPGGAGWEL